LHLDREADGVDHAAELDDRAVAGALDDAAVVRRDGGVDEIAAQRPKTRKRSIIVGAGLKPTTSATRIAASLRVSLIPPLLESPH
jgi:hypothetical protein